MTRLVIEQTDIWVSGFHLERIIDEFLMQLSFCSAGSRAVREGALGIGERESQGDFTNYLRMEPNGNWRQLYEN